MRKKKKKKKRKDITESYDCDRCGLLSNVKTPRMKAFDGGYEKGVVVVAQSPGRVEDKKGRPLIGQSGNLTDRVVYSVGLDMEKDFVLTNSFRCRPVGISKTKGYMAQQKYCHKFLLDDLEKFDPWLVIAMGKEAIQSVLGLWKAFKVSQFNNLLIPLPDRGFWLYCMYHPAALIHDRSDYYSIPFADGWSEVAGLIEEKEKGRDFRKELEDIKSRYWSCDVIVPKTADEVERYIDGFREMGLPTFVDYENFPLLPFGRDDAKALCVAYYNGRLGPVCIPLDKIPVPSKKRKVWTPQERELILSAHLRFMADENIVKKAWNLQHEYTWNWWLGGDIKGSPECSMLRQHILREKSKGMSKKREDGGLPGPKAQVFQAFARFGIPFYDEPMHKYLKDPKGYDAAPDEKLFHYNGMDVYLGFHIDVQQQNERYSGIEFAEEVFFKGARTMASCRYRGFNIDQDIAGELAQKWEGEEKEIKEKLLGHKWVREWEKEEGKSINLRSSQQVGKMLFDQVGLKHPFGREKGKTEKTKKWKMTGEVKEKLAENHPWVADLMRMIQLASWRVTFIGDGRGTGHIFGNLYLDGKIHPSILLHTAESGRSSSQGPNIQNFPKRSAEAREVRKALIADPGYDLHVTDYSQWEVLIEAGVSQCPVLKKYVQDGVDFHRRYAALLLNKAESKVSEDERNLTGKLGFVFSKFYGSSIGGIAGGLPHIPFRRLEKVYYEFEDEFYGVTEHQQMLVEFYNKNGYIENPYGFRRRAPLTVTEIINFIIQSTAYHVFMEGLNDLEERLKEEKLDAGFLCQIHDESVLSRLSRDRDKILELQYETQILKPKKKWSWLADLPIGFGIKEGQNMYELKKITELK